MGPIAGPTLAGTSGMNDQDQKQFGVSASALSDTLVEFENGLNARRFGHVARCTYTPPKPSTVGVGDDGITVAIDRQGSGGWTLWIYERKVWKQICNASVAAKIEAASHIPALMLELQSAIKRQSVEAATQADKLAVFMRSLEEAARK